MNKLTWSATALLVGGLLLLPQLTISSDKILTILTQVFIAAALAASWNILAGYAGQVNLGHAAFFGVGSLVTRLMWFNDYPFMLSFLAGGVVATLFALIIGAPALRLRGIYFAVGTLALAEALQRTVGTMFPGNSAMPGPRLAAYELAPRYYLTLGLLGLIVAVSYWLTRSKLGLGMMAVREDETAALSIGISAFRHKLTAFVLSALFAGLTGSAFAYFHVSYYYQLPFTAAWTFDAVLVTFVGGIGTVAGPLIGAVFFVLVRDVLATNLTNFHLIIFGALFILVVLVLPGGLLELWYRVTRVKKTLRPLEVVESTSEMKGGEEMT